MSWLEKPFPKKMPPDGFSVNAKAKTKEHCGQAFLQAANERGDKSYFRLCFSPQPIPFFYNRYKTPT